MEQKRIISASILSADLSNLTSECQNVINDGADWIHLDIILLAMLPQRDWKRGVSR